MGQGSRSLDTECSLEDINLALQLLLSLHPLQLLMPLRLKSRMSLKSF